MLELRALSLSREGFSLLADLTVSGGARVALLGPSGAGKSTLLALIAGFERPQEGQVLWNGADITAQPPGQRPVSIVFQDNNLFPHLNVAQNIGLGRQPTLRLSAEDEWAVEATMKRVGLGGLGARKSAELSGGQQSRVALARCLLRARPLLLLDEPFAALGPALKSEMLDLVADTAREAGLTVLVVTHDPADALRFADETIVVAEGQAHAPVQTQKLFEHPPEALRAYLGQ